MTLLAVEGLCKSFGGVRALDGVSFTAAAGRILSIIGPNGAGKTTLLNLITGVYAPSGGQVRLDGEEVTGLPPDRLAARGLSRTFQNLQVFRDMTALENVMVGRHLHLERRLLPCLLRLPAVRRSDRQARERAAELMRELGIASYLDRPAASMPYGALKRLEIARAMAAEPRLLLLDEPAAGLNARECGEIEALIRMLAGRGIAILLVEHDMRLVMRISDRILVLDYGRKLAEGSAGEVRANPEVIAAYLGVAPAG